MNLRELRIYNKVLRVLPIEELDKAKLILAGHHLRGIYFKWNSAGYFTFKKKLDVKYFGLCSEDEAITSIIWLLNRMEVVIAYNRLQSTKEVDMLYGIIRQAIPFHIVNEIQKDGVPTILGVKLKKEELTKIQWGGDDMPLEQPTGVIGKLINVFKII